MRDYEIVYILDPDLSEEAVAGLMERFRALAASQGAEIRSQERWEKRRLAYEIKDKREGIYVVMELKATPAAIHEVDRILKLTDGVLRHLIVRVEEGKRTSVRDLRSAQPAEPAAAAPAAPATAPAPAAAPEPAPQAPTPEAEEAPSGASLEGEATPAGSAPGEADGAEPEAAEAAPAEPGPIEEPEPAPV